MPMPGVLFVCTANVCRSPMAEVLFRGWLRRNAVPGVWWVGSAGTWAVEGALASPYAFVAMANRGLDLARHRTRRVHAGILAAHDVILCMTRSHQEGLQVGFPEHAQRIRLFSEMIGKTFDILDPYGSSQAEYFRTAQELADVIEGGAQTIVALASRAK